ncbi:Mus7/MMS22 family-domain-containing protein, partial [Paraphysoderma sedebokerense]
DLHILRAARTQNFVPLRIAARSLIQSIRNGQKIDLYGDLNRKHISIAQLPSEASWAKNSHKRTLERMKTASKSNQAGRNLERYLKPRERRSSRSGKYLKSRNQTNDKAISQRVRSNNRPNRPRDGSKQSTQQGAYGRALENWNTTKPPRPMTKNYTAKQQNLDRALIKIKSRQPRAIIRSEPGQKKKAIKSRGKPSDVFKRLFADIARDETKNDDRRTSTEGIVDLTCDDTEGQATTFSSRRTARVKQAPMRRNNFATTEREWYESNFRTDDNEDDDYECRYDEFGIGEVDADKSPAHNQGLTESDHIAVQKPRQRQHQQSITDFLTAESSSSRKIDKLSNYFPLHFSVAPLAAGTQCAASFKSRMNLIASCSGQCSFSPDTSSYVRATSKSSRVEARWEVFQASISLKDHETVLSLLPSWFDEIGVSVLESSSSNCRFSKSRQLLERCLEEVIQFGAFISAYIVSLSAHSPFGGQQNVEQVNSHRSSKSVFAFVKRLYESMQEWINQFGDYDRFYHFCASTSPRMRLRKFAAFQIYTKLLSYFLEWAYLISSNIVIEDTELPSDDISRANTVTLLDSFSFPVFSKQLFRQMIILSLGEPDLGVIFHGMDKNQAEYTIREWNLDPLNELWVLAVKLIDLFAYRAALQSYSDDFGRPGNSWDILKETVDYIMNDSEFQLTGLPTVMVPPLKITSFKYAWLSESIWKVVFDMLRISQFDANLAISSQPSHSLQISVYIHKASDEWDLIDRLLKNSVVSGSLNEDELQKWTIHHMPESRRRIGRDLRDNGIRAILERYHSLIFHWNWQPHVGTVLLIASWFQKRMFENLDLEGIRWNKRLHDEILFPRYWRDLVMSTNTSAPIVTELAISADDSAMSIFLKIVHLNLSVPDSTEHHRRSKRKLEMKILPTNSVTLPRPSSTVPASCNHTLTTLINRYSLLLLCIRIFSVHDADRYSKFNRMMINLCNFPESIDEARMISITSWMIHAKMNLIGGLSLQPVIQALSGYIKIISDEWNRTINEGQSLIFNADKNEEKMNVLVMIFSNLERLLKWQNRLKPFLLCDEHSLLSGDFLEIIRLEKCPPNALLGAVISFCSTFISELSKSKSSMTLTSQVGISHCPDVDIGDSQFSDHFDWDDLMDVNINTDNPNEELAVENLKSVLVPLLSDIVSAKLGTILRLNYPVPKASKLPKINDEVARSALECVAELAVLFREKDHTLETNLITQYSQLPFIMGQIHQKHELCVYFTYKLLQLDPTYYEQYQGQINELVFTALIKPRCAPSWDLVKLVLKHPKHSEFFRNLATSSRHSDLNDSTKRTRLKLLRGIFKNMGKIFFETRARSVSESSILKRQYEDIIIKLCDRMRGFVEDSTEHHSNDSSKYAQFCFDVVELLFEHCSNIIYDSSSSTVLWGPVHPNITYFSSKSLIGFAHLTHQLRSIGTTSFWVEDIRTRDSVISLFRAEFEDITIEELNAMHKQSRLIAFAEALRNSALTAITVDEWSNDLSNFRLFILKTFVMSYYNSFLREPVQNNSFWLLASVATQFLQVLYCFIQQDILKLRKCHQPAAILAVCSEIYLIIKVVAQVVLSISDSISPSIAILAKATFSLIATLTSLVSSLSLLMPSDRRLDSFQKHYTQFLSCIIHHSHSYYLSHHRTIRKSQFLDKYLIQFEHAGLSFQSAELELCQNDIPSCNINPQRQRPPVVDINQLNRDEWLDDTVTSIFNLWTEIVNYDSKFLPWLLETLPLLYEFYSLPQRLSKQVNLFNAHLVVPLGLSGQNYLIEARHLKRSKRTRRFSVDAIVL